MPPRPSPEGGPKIRSPGTSASRSSASVASAASLAWTASSPTPSSHSIAAASPIASPIGGVPASNFAGRSAHVISSRVTLRIIDPPPMNGPIASSRSRRPRSTPIPVGPYALWPVKA